MSDPEGYLAAVSIRMREHGIYSQSINKTPPPFLILLFFSSSSAQLSSASAQADITSLLLQRSNLGTVVVAGLSVSVGGVSTASHESQSLHDGQASKDCPDEVTKCDGSLNRPTTVVIAVRNTETGSDSSGTGEPEERGNGENAQSNHVVVDARSKARREGEVEQHENGPDGTEEQKSVRRRRPVTEEVDHCIAVSIMMMLYAECIRTYCKL